jgi:hypothetical protein
MNRAVSATTIAASGTFTKNTARQLTCSISQPPTIGPIAAVMALKPDHMPMARPRSAPSNVALMMARLPGTRKAAPMPCTARATISTRVDAARPQPIDAIVNSMTPARNVRFRPNWSPREPPTSVRLPRNHAYASITHCTSVMVAWRSAWSAGSATLTTVPSMNVRLDPMIVATSVHVCDEWPSARVVWARASGGWPVVMAVMR